MEAIGKNVNDEARLFVNTDVASSVINPKIASTASSEYWNRGGDLNHAASKVKYMFTILLFLLLVHALGLINSTRFVYAQQCLIYFLLYRTFQAELDHNGLAFV